jgi:hypothetical protein
MASPYSLTVFATLARCESAGLTITASPDGNLHVSPVSALTQELRADLRAYKPLIWRRLYPHLNEQGELVIPFGAPARFHWWQGGQSALDTSIEIGAPDEVLRRLNPPAPTLRKGTTIPISRKR